MENNLFCSLNLLIANAPCDWYQIPNYYIVQFIFSRLASF